MSLLADRVIGTWRLTSREDRTSTGELRLEPGLGQDPIALLIYDRGGNFAAQFMKRDRTGFIAAGPASNNSTAVGGYDAYFGKYKVDEVSGAVTQTLEAALSPGNVGMVVTRGLQVEGNTLIIRLKTNALDGTPVERTLRWMRAA
ncbi:MAG TPA: lipocalin-like domain-containing protein [Myxococcales bacterium]|jgi:hypothetical protein|nr:lipocalin-like domain-containing protein [Myxococcales bacterium]